MYANICRKSLILFLFNLQCFEDKSNIGKFILASREHHILVIDTREERLISRGRNWVNELIAKMQRLVDTHRSDFGYTNFNRFRDEIDRNRAKIIEINTFLDKQRDRYDRLHEEVQKEQEMEN